jgi:hypothetical protein
MRAWYGRRSRKASIMRLSPCRVSMRRRLILQQSLARPLIVVTTLAALAYSQAPSPQQQLNAQYKSVQIRRDGAIVGTPGTQLAVRKGGIIAVP